MIKEHDADYTPLRGYSKEAQSIVKQMLKRNALERPKAHELLKHPWFIKSAIETKGTRLSTKNAELQLIESSDHFTRVHSTAS